MEYARRLIILYTVICCIKAYRKLICEGETGVIRCGKDQKIRIIRGTYGRSNPSTCWTGAGEDHDNVCVVQTALLKLYEQCSEKQICNLTASHAVFGNACSNSSSYLDVEYFCEGTVVVCEGYVSTVHCPDHGKISIINSNYGRRNTRFCPYGNVRSIHCYSKITTDVLLHECEGRSSCRFDSSNDVFGDPCSATYKYLEANYRCNT